VVRAFLCDLKERRKVLTRHYSHFMAEIPEIYFSLPHSSLLLLCQVEQTSLSATRKKHLFHTDVLSVLELLEKNSMSGLLKALFFFIQTCGITP
jgi:hypothetical protein